MIIDQEASDTITPYVSVALCGAMLLWWVVELLVWGWRVERENTRLRVMLSRYIPED